MAYEQDRSFGNPVDYNKTTYVEERSSGGGWIVAILLVGALLAAVFFLARGGDTTVVTDPTLAPTPLVVDDGTVLPPADVAPMAPGTDIEGTAVPAAPTDDGIAPADDGVAPADDGTAAPAAPATGD